MTKTRKSGDTASRDDRLGAALRANLVRRKAQARARAHKDEQQEGDRSQDNAPESEE
ncbi:hypothetical protein [Paracoccus albus]|uniref:hypothetical protein n=1 Tax=Paracoccus albus TaxID=3017784 RepID=UPI0022F0DFC6|nr:hypothetical protein [Paracoccus albus]WBU59337.1 hypothetical protein PAF20_11210 [Paracoccus albus]